MDKEKFIEWETIEVKGSQGGVKKTTCPACSHTRKKKKDPCLYVNFESGVAKCYNCERLSFRDEGVQDIKREYTLPPQEWRNYTALHDKVVEFCEGRRIRQSTLMHFNVTQEAVYMPQRERKVNAITFNYFENTTIVNKKYRDLQKNFTQSKGGKPIFYNINSVIGSEKVYIVEGEFDVMAMYEAGIKNCISLPSGANDNDDYWTNSKTYLSDVKEFIIAVDNDEKGLIIREKIAQRLGRYRCSFIEWKGKDANDDLISGDIYNSVANAKRFPVGGTFNSEDLFDGILELYEKGLPDTLWPKKAAFGDMYKKFSVMRGHLVVGTGIPSHGKSTFTEWLVLNLIDEYDLKTSMFSPEHSPLALHMANLAQQAVGKPFFGSIDGVEKCTKEDLQRFKEWSKERLYLTTAENGQFATWDWLFTKFEEQIYTYGIDVFVIDAFNKVILPSGMNKKDAIDEQLTKLTQFAQLHNVVIFLIAHPTKMGTDEKGKQKIPTLYDVSGSADFRNQTHDGYTIHRVWDNIESGIEGYTSFYNGKTKMAFQGEIGAEIRFKYHLPTRRYYVEGCDPYHLDLTQKGGREPIDFNADEYIEPKKLQPNEDFDFENAPTDTPF
jgi:twinkle protein